MDKNDFLPGDTIYWNPNIEVGLSGKTSVTFYNSDVKMEAVCTIAGRKGKLLGSTRNAFVVY